LELISPCLTESIHQQRFIIQPPTKNGLQRLGKSILENSIETSNCSQKPGQRGKCIIPTAGAGDRALKQTQTGAQRQAVAPSESETGVNQGKWVKPTKYGTFPRPSPQLGCS